MPAVERGQTLNLTHIYTQMLILTKTSLGLKKATETKIKPMSKCACQPFNRLKC